MAVLLTLVTAGLFTFPNHYAPLGGERLADGTFVGSGEGPPAGWQADPPSQVRLEKGVLVLEATPADPMVSIRQTIPAQGDEIAWRLAVDLRTIGVAAGPESWQRARVYLLERQSDGTYLGDPRGDLARLAGTTGWTRYVGTVPSHGDPTEMAVIIRLHDTPGVIEVRSVSLQGLGLSAPFKLLAAMLSLCWAAVILWGGVLLARRAERPRLFGGLVGAGVIGLVLLVAPHIVRDEVVDWSSRALDGLLSRELVAKLGHFLIFATIASLLRLSTPRGTPSVQLGILILAGGIGEVLQFLSLGRTPSPRDWGINVAGAVTGFAATWLLSRLASGRRQPDSAS